MNCEECRQHISEYVDGELDEAAAKDFDAHTADCDDCRRAVESMRSMAAAVADLPQHTPGTETILRISETIHESDPAPAPVQKAPHEFGAVLDIDELAAFLRVDREAVAVYLEELPSFELGGKLLFRKSKIEEWVSKREMRIEGAVTRDAGPVSTNEMHIELDEDDFASFDTPVPKHAKSGGERWTQ